MENKNIKFPRMKLKEIEEMRKEIFGPNEKQFRGYLFQLFHEKDPITKKDKFSERFQLLCEHEAKIYDLSKKSGELATLFSGVLKYFREKGFLDDQQFDEEYEECKKIWGKYTRIAKL
jgi:hypothetical protein